MLYDRQQSGMFDFTDIEHPQLSEAFLMAQKARPKCSDVLSNLSGVSDKMAANPLAKLQCALLTNSFRPEDMGRIIKLMTVLDVPKHARVYREKNGRGNTFFRIRYDSLTATGNRHRHSLYLGTDGAVAEWAQGILEERRWKAGTGRSLTSLKTERIQLLRQLLRESKSVAEIIAGHAGFRFRGARLMRRRLN